MMRYVTMFFRFWWDFLIGDTPELAIGALAIIGLAMLLVRANINAVIIIPTAIVILLAFSAYRGARQSK